MKKYLKENEVVELASLLEHAYYFVKGGPDPELENYLLQFENKLRNILQQGESPD